MKAHSRGFAPQAKRCEPPLTSRFVIPCCPLLSPGSAELRPQRGPTQALNGPGELRTVTDPLSNLCSIRCSGGDLARPGLGPADRGAAGAVRAELLGVDLATVRELAANVEPYLRADGTSIWSLMQLERQLRPEAYGRRRGGYLDRRRSGRSTYS